MSILVISVESDFTTNKVLQWFQYYKLPFKRINLDTNINFVEELFGLNLNEISGYWYRRGDLTKTIYNNYDSEFQKYLTENNKKLLEYFEYKMMKKKNLNSFFNTDINKLIVLEMAKDLGLIIPDFHLIQSTKTLDSLNYIYKTINRDGNIFDYKNKSVFNVLTQELTKHIDYNFSLTLFQKKIEKKFEIRSFYLDGNFYSMVILSQQNEATRIDYRAIGEHNKARMVPYSLPSSIEEKLKCLMLNIGINSGVIDIIVTPTNEYVFLEVNPVGHFGLISYACNYNIEKKIAKFYTNEQ
ncbi:grasp-with-spasm system ATP-grasp peptide maturase [Chryseobacterium sp. S-02]|uniref:grasp-with-spasm system ATP-grasp peptide maturase n=1 Tax=Chryseobacterium sp. S-02 TaxID=3404064 RepID=UPI003CEFBAF0